MTSDHRFDPLLLKSFTGSNFPPKLITLLVIQATSLAFSMELAGQISLPATNAGNQITADKAEKGEDEKSWA